MEKERSKVQENISKVKDINIKKDSTATSDKAKESYVYNIHGNAPRTNFMVRKNHMYL